MKETIQVLLGTNDKYLPGAIVTMLSIIRANHLKNRFLFYVMDTGISIENKTKLIDFFVPYPTVEIQFKQVDVDCFKSEGAPEGPGGGYSTYARLLMTDFIESDRCIYVDTDFFVRLDFSELWELPMDGYGVAACLDTSKTGESGYNVLSWDCPFESAESVSSYGYYNAGLLVCNLIFWREFEFQDKVKHLLKSFATQLDHHDQTLINYIFRGKILALSPEWNLPPWWTRPLDAKSNMHFTAYKPWTLRTYLPAEKIWFSFYDTLVKPRWDVIKISRNKTKGIYHFLRFWGLPALIAEPYCLLLKWFSKRDDIYRQNRFIVLKKIRKTLILGPDTQTKKTIRDFRRSLRAIIVQNTITKVSPK